MKGEKYFPPFHSEGSAPSRAFHREANSRPAREEAAAAARGVRSAGQPEVSALVTWLPRYWRCFMKGFSEAGSGVFNLRNRWGELQNLCVRLCNRTGFLDCCNMCTPMVLLLIFWIKSCVRSQMAWEHLVIPTAANTSSHKKKRRLNCDFTDFFIS